MFGRRTKLRFRRSLRRRQKQAREFGDIAEDSLNRYIFKRLMRLFEVRRFVLAWVGLIALLIVGVILQSRALSSHYLEVAPSPGGTYREGIIGTFTNANPLYAQTEVDASASRLIFSGLFSHDKNGSLIPDLAEKYELDSTETLYTVFLKPNLTWHDGRPLTSKDIVYTYTMIQNPEAKSYLFSSWRGIEVRAVDDRTVTFKLTNSLSAFPQSLVNGIIPEHILSKTPANQLRSSSFNNQRPIGSGPFAFEAVEVGARNVKNNSAVAFQAFDGYHEGQPKLERFIIRSYPDEKNLVDAFNNNEIDAMSGLTVVPETIDTQTTRVNTIPLTSQVMVFFKTNQDVLKDINVRKALVLGTNKSALFESLSYPVLSINQPLLPSQIGYNKAYAQATNNPAEANKILDEAGWVRNPETGIRVKDGMQLKFKLFSSSNSDFTSISGGLQKQWRELGAEVEVVLQDDSELQSSVATHNYDAIMYGIALGTDPDVYAYWHGSQSDVRSETRLNLSEYKSSVADKSLEAGRTRTDRQNRAVKYRPFLEAWRADAPALALFQPQYLYITTDKLSGFEYDVSNSSVDRYTNVNQWMIRKSPQRIE